MSVLVIGLLVIVLLNLSLKISVEYTLNEKQLSLAITLQYAIFHLHKHFNWPFNQLRQAHFQLPALHTVRLQPNRQTRRELKRALRGILRHLHVQQLAADIRVTPAAYPLLTTCYGVGCAILGACHKSRLPLAISLTPLKDDELFFIYGQGIVSMSIGHIMYAAIVLSSQFFKQYWLSLTAKERRIAGERTSY